ncbi:MAG: nucleotidyltransferase family protein [bacterium]|nr:nucleotidyltransferase family protein [bacterium]
MTTTLHALDLVRLGADGGDLRKIHSDTVCSEGLEGLLVARRVPSGADQAGWRDAYVTTAARTVVVLQELAGTLRQLHASGTEVVVLPGAALLRFYPDAGCRPMDDIDLLCAPGQCAAVAGLLLQRGWAATPRHPDLLSKGHVCLDLHEDLFHCERIGARRYAGWLDPQDVWSRRRRASVQGIDVWVLGPEDEVLYTAAHALRHSYRRLTWLIDLALQLRDEKLDMGRLRTLGGSCGLARPVLFGLALLQAARVELPPPARDWYDECAPGALELHLLHWTLGARQTTCVGEMLWYWTSPSWSDRGRLFQEFVFPRTEVLLQVFPRVPRSLAPVVYGLRCGQLMKRFLLEMLAMMPAPANRRARRG